MTAKLTIGISALHFSWATIEEALRRCRDEYQIEAIEFSADGELLARRPDEIRRLAGEAGVTLCLHAWENLAEGGRAQAERTCRYWMDYCRSIGALNCVMHLGSHDDRAYGLALVAEVAEKVAPDFERAGVTLALENHYPYEYHDCHELGGGPEEFEFIGRLGSPAIRFCLDTGHANMCGGSAPFLEKLGPVLGHVHIADNMGVNDDHLPYRRGTVDWDATLRGMLATGFRGPYVIEFPEKSGIEAQKRFISDLRDLDRQRMP